MNPPILCSLRNGETAVCSQESGVSFEQFRTLLGKGIEAGHRLSALFVVPDDSFDGARLVAVLARPMSGDLQMIGCAVGSSYPALTPGIPAAHWFEREIFEQWGIRPEGHPWLKPIRFQPPRSRSGGRPSLLLPTVGVTEFFRVEGEDVHEVAVGPVHAGVIEPGHFRFQCHGETVYHLEISLGYQHRGIERAVGEGNSPRMRHYIETLAGDSTIGHATAYCRVLEGLAGVRPSPRAEAVRMIAAELERLANHIGDLGAMAGDVGFLPAASYCGRIRGDVLNLTAELCGNRFGRGLIVPGGTGFDLDQTLESELKRRLDDIEADALSAIEQLFETPSVLARFDGVGEVSESLARQIGLVGVAGRASGLPCDVRSEFPYGFYQFVHVPVCTWGTGDCLARALVRRMEIQQSFAAIRALLQSLPADRSPPAVMTLAPRRWVASLTEGWRGEICHVAATDDEGQLAFYKVVDPSFHNWFGLACAMRDQLISDFPLCNKSFNLSYCGHDL